MIFNLTKPLLLVTVIISGGFYLYYKESQETISTLNQEVATLKIAEKENKETIASLRENYTIISQELEQVNQEFRHTRAQNQELIDKLRDHNLGLLGNAKPGLVENIVTSASNKALRCFELLSGAELTEDEKNASSAQSFNSECPWMFDTYRN